MAKQTGLGDNFYVGGTDLSGDVNSLQSIRGGPATIDVTDITQGAYERLGGLRDGEVTWTSYFNTTRAHPSLSTLPTADVGLMYVAGGGVAGNPAACMVGKQINYDPTRGQDGDLKLAVSTQANGFGLEWGRLVTAGFRTDTTATATGTGIDTTASLSFGGQAYLQVASAVGTSVTVKLQDSADNSTGWADIFTFAAVAPAGAPQAQRIVIANTSTIRRYVRAATAGTFTSAVFAVALVKNNIAGVVF
jgi:hypothetical protein